MFSKFARMMSTILGHSFAFTFAVLLIIAWVASGPFYHFSDTWQLVINTGTTIMTFLMVFLLQNTQNRDTVALHLKLDEIIRSMKSAHNELLKIEELSDEDLEKLQKRYESLAESIKKRINTGQDDTGTPDIEPSQQP